MKDNAKSLSDKAFVQSIVILLLSIFLCIVCLCTMTWAWFNENISSASSTIKTGNCVVDVAVSYKDGENTVALPPDAFGTYELKQNVEYTFTISATGTASSAYCKFIINGEENYTQQIAIGSQITFTMKFTSEDTVVGVDKLWGESSRATREIYSNGNYVDISLN